MRGKARSSVKDGGTGRGVQVTLGRGFGWRLMGRLGFGIVAVGAGAVLGALGGFGTLGFGGGSGICLPLPGSIPVILEFPSSITATESAPVFFAARVKLLDNRNEQGGIWGTDACVPGWLKTHGFTTSTTVAVAVAARASKRANE